MQQQGADGRSCRGYRVWLMFKAVPGMSIVLLAVVGPLRDTAFARVDNADKHIASHLARRPGTTRFQMSLENVSAEYVAVNRDFRRFEIIVFDNKGVKLSDNLAMMQNRDFMHFPPDTEWLCMQSGDKLEFCLDAYDRKTGMELQTLPAHGYAVCKPVGVLLKYPDYVPAWPKKIKAPIIRSFPSATVKW